MPPITPRPGHGQGKQVTPWKELGIRESIELIERHIPSSRMFFFADMNSGCGFNHKVGVDGSSIEFLKTMMSKGRKYKALFCDRNKGAIFSLQRRVEKLVGQNAARDILLFRGNNKKAFAEFDRIIRRHDKALYAMGAILLDPNGPSPSSFPLAEASKFFSTPSCFTRIDVIVNYNIQGALRSLSCEKKEIEKRRLGIPSGITKHSTSKWAARTISEVMGVLNKSNWVVREPVSGRGNKYVILVGRNFSGDVESSRLGFYPLKSKRGREIVEFYDNQLRSAYYANNQE